jgi:hypothetical protein
MAAAAHAATLADKMGLMDERQRTMEADLGLLRQTVHELLLENRRLALGVAPRALAQSRALASAEPLQPPPTAEPPSAAGDCGLGAYLERLRLGHFCDRVRNLGAETVADLVDVEADDLVALGMTKLEQNRFFRAVRAQGVLSERAAIRHGDALEMLVHVDAAGGALEAAVQATGWDMQDEWVHGTRALLREWSSSGGRLEQARHQELLAVALTAAEQEHATERLLHCMRTALPSLTVQLTGCGAIQRLAAADSHMAIELSGAGACLDVLRAFRYHGNDATTLSVEGCHALASLARNGGPQVGRAVGQAGGVASALACMSQHAEDSEIFAAACALLQAVPISEFWERTAQAEAAAAAQRRRQNGDSTHHLNPGSRDGALRAENDAPSTLSVVVGGITKHWEHAAAQAAACALIEHLVEHSEESKAPVAATGCIEVVIAALKGKRTMAAGAGGLAENHGGETNAASQRRASSVGAAGAAAAGSAAVGFGAVVAVARQRDVAARLQAHGCGLLANLATGTYSVPHYCIKT